MEKGIQISDIRFIRHNSQPIELPLEDGCVVEYEAKMGVVLT